MSKVFKDFRPDEHVLRPDSKIIIGKNAVICIDGKPIGFAKDVSYNIDYSGDNKMWDGDEDMDLYGYGYGHSPEGEDKTPKITDLITEIQKLTLDDDETLVIKVPQEMLDETFLRQMQQMLIAAFGDKVRKGKVMIVPDGVKLEKVKENKPHPIYGDKQW